MWYPNLVSITSDISFPFNANAADSNSGTKSPLFAKPSSPPFLADSVSSEYKVARTLKSSPFLILSLKEINFFLILDFSSVLISGIFK